MGYLTDPKTTTILITASTIPFNGRRRKIIVETRPEFAILHLHGSKQRYPLAWESIFDAAVKHDVRSRDLERRTKRSVPVSERPTVSEDDPSDARLPAAKLAAAVGIRRLRLA